MNNTTMHWITFLHNFIAGFLMPWLGLLLVNIRPSMKKLVIIALSYAVLGVLLRSYLPYDISFYIQILFLLISVTILLNFSLLKAIVATIFGVIVLVLGELVFTLIIIEWFGPDVVASTNPLIKVFVPLPQIVMTIIIIYLCIRFKFYLFNFQETISETSVFYESKRTRTTAFLVVTILIVIIIQMIFSFSVINKGFSFFHGLALPLMGAISTTVLILGLIAMALLIIQLVELTQKESQYHMQAIYIETLDELYTAIRSERHDIINHLQTIYGFNQLGYKQEVQEYLSELMGGNILSNEFITTGSPGLTALFYIKSGIARTNDITFKVEVDTPIDSLKVSTYELNNILGNLINNAFDAVMPLDTDQRLVMVYIGSNAEHYIFKVSNYGYIEDDIKEKILRKGYSTKKGEHLGLGLHICHNLAQKYGGRLDISNNDKHMVNFSVYFPRKLEKGDLYEFAGQENSSFDG
ncbi:MAG: hypothetical protein CVU90_00095 [Firmicutes bacterium HGW-Firmicutes-15]|nr:MAG: hypothetical protein CVU90_00095 [Firmicutes bacterium HGW-Firmicutes-15]